jgi:hypothetical protein
VQQIAVHAEKNDHRSSTSQRVYANHRTLIKTLGAPRYQSLWPIWRSDKPLKGQADWAGIPWGEFVYPEPLIRA